MHISGVLSKLSLSVLTLALPSQTPNMLKARSLGATGYQFCTGPNLTGNRKYLLSVDPAFVQCQTIPGPELSILTYPGVICHVSKSTDCMLGSEALKFGPNQWYATQVTEGWNAGYRSWNL